MELVAHLDFESGSPVDLRKAGLYRQLEHPGFRIWLFRWCLLPRGTKPTPADIKPWFPGAPDPGPLLDHIWKGGTVVAHNASYERTVWPWFVRNYVPHWPLVKMSQWDCTMARCAALAVPQSLDFVAQVFNLDYKKDREGHALMLKMARPRTRKECFECSGTGRRALVGDPAFDTPGPCIICGGAGEVYTWWDTSENLHRLGIYCDGDVLTEVSADNTVPPLSAEERRVLELDWTINDRGVKLDMPLVNRALAVIRYATAQLDDEMATLTGGQVTKISQVQRLVKWINEQGVSCKSIAKGEQEELLTMAAFDNVPQVVHALELRTQAKSSTAKYTAMANCVCKDGRARGLLQYHGASTGRWAGRLIQPQNLYRVDAERDGDDIRLAVDILMHRLDPADAAMSLDLVLARTDERGFLQNAPMVMLAKCIRTMFIAEDGTRFVGGDSSNIEGRVNAWLAGEEWKVQAFRDYDAGLGPDLYNKSYADSFGGDPMQVRGFKRQIGKVLELYSGYQGGHGAFISMGKNYGVTPQGVVDVVRAATDPTTWFEAAKRYRQKGTHRFDLAEDPWTALKVITDNWRGRHPKITSGWWDLQDAAIEAVAEPGLVVPVFGGRVRYLFARGFLWCSLPSGRLLAYFNPRVVETDDSYFQHEDGSRIPLAELSQWERDVEVALGAHLVKRQRRRVDFDGYDGERKQWNTNNLYGGHQCENIVQAIARDTLVSFAFEAEDRGYPIVLTVHDELLCEVPVGHGSAEELRMIMQTNPSWCADLPLAAKTWEDVRYSK